MKNFNACRQVGLMALVVALLVLNSCKEPVNEYKLIDNALPNSSISASSKVSIPLCSIFNADWDSIVVIGPYIMSDEVKKLHINNYRAVNGLIDSQSKDDSHCTLLFIKKGKYVGYNVILRSKIDFDALIMESKSQAVLIRKNNCSQFYVENFTNSKFLFVKQNRRIN